MTITNISRVTDNSGELPVITYSNPVTTVIRERTPARMITRIFCCQQCNCNECNCGCGCNACNSCGCCNRCKN